MKKKILPWNSKWHAYITLNPSEYVNIKVIQSILLSPTFLDKPGTLPGTV